MMRVRLDLRNAAPRLERMSEALRDLSPVWPTVHEIVVRFFRAIFAAEGAYPTGESWVALSPSYAKWKARHYPGQPILQLTGHLVSSMEGGADHVFRFGPAWMETGTSDRKARAHHFGWPLRHLPRRPIVRRPSKAEGERIVDAILGYLLGAARRTR